MNIAERDQLAAVARDAGRAAKEAIAAKTGTPHKILPTDVRDSIETGVHMARELIRAGVPAEVIAQDVPLMRALYEGTLATLEAFISGAKPMDDWS